MFLSKLPLWSKHFKQVIILEKIRAFIAVNLSEENKVAVEKIQKDLQKYIHIDNYKWVEPHNIHLTLHFFGNIHSSEIPGIRKAMNRTAGDHSDFRIVFNKPGAFNSFTKPDIIWVGPDNSDRLLKLQEDLLNNLKLNDFEINNRKFSPHITLGRLKQKNEKKIEEISHSLTNYRVKENIILKANSFSLIKSDLTSSGPIYSTLHKEMILEK